MVSTQTSAIDPALAALIPSGSQIYDAIMGSIEPELVSSNLPQLEQQYAGEDAEERVERMARYKEAFRRYDELYNAWVKNVRIAVEAKRLDAFKKAEVKAQANDTAALQALDDQFTASAG